VLCCIIAAAFILKYAARKDTIKRYLGYTQSLFDQYGYAEYCEIDDFES